MPATTFSRISLGVEQLDMAIEIFLSERSDVSALTLAGAAEEILGQAVKKGGGESSMSDAYKVIAPIHKLLNRTELTWKKFADDENFECNAAKHMSTSEEERITTDLRSAAQRMIIRACENCNRLNCEQSDRIYEFNNWFHENEVGF